MCRNAWIVKEVAGEILEEGEIEGERGREE